MRAFSRGTSYKSLKPTAGFILDKTIGTNCPKRLENAKILIANTCGFVSVGSVLEILTSSLFEAMDTDKIKVFGARIKVDSTGKLAELERAEKVCHSNRRSESRMNPLRRRR